MNLLEPEAFLEANLQSDSNEVWKEQSRCSQHESIASKKKYVCPCDLESSYIPRQETFKYTVITEIFYASSDYVQLRQ